MYTDLPLYIDGAWHDGKGRKGEDVINPATEKPLAHLPHASKADLDRALESAKKGFAIWRDTSAYDRCKIMRKAADLMRERHDHISQGDGAGAGQAVRRGARRGARPPPTSSTGMRRRAAAAYGRIVPGRSKGMRQLVMQEPVGIVGGIHAVEFPGADARPQGRRRAGGRLLAHPQGVGGDAGRLRRDGEVLRRRRAAGGRAQSGVRRAGGGLRASDPPRTRCKKISFTGSIPVGKHLAAPCRQGHEARHHGTRRPFAGGGVRRCRSGEGRRHHRGLQVSQCRPGLHLADALLRAGGRLQDASSSASPNTPRGEARRRPGEGRHHGPARQFAPARRDGSFVADAKARGGKIETGGKRRGNQGYFYEPTVITEVPDDSKIMTAGAVRAARADRHLQDLRRGRRARQLAGVRSRRLRVHDLGRRPRPRSAMRSNPAWSASTRSRSRRPRRRSAASRNPATAARAASKGSGLSQHQVHLAGMI